MDTIMLHSDRLTVGIGSPGALYRGVRFDHTGHIRQVTLDGSHDFCVEESLIDGVGSGGSGLCNEFGIRACDAVGYQDADPGEEFLKIGVGLLTKIDGSEYGFWKDYPASLFEVVTRTGPDFVEFRTRPSEVRGYSVELIKAIRVEGTRIHVGYALTNTGSRVINTDEYCHNFISPGRAGIGPGIILETGFPMDISTDSPGVSLKDGVISWTEQQKEPFYIRIAGWEDAREVWWRVTDTATGLWMSEETDFKPQRMAVWGMGHVVSPEVFVPICLEPGRTKAWSRRFTFGCRS